MKNDRPSILFLAHRIPFPPDRGDKIRSWHLIERLSRRATIHLACFADDLEDAAQLSALHEALNGKLGEAHVEVRRKGRVVPALKALATGRPLSLALFDSPSLRRFVNRHLESDDVGTVFGFSGQMAQFVPKGLSQRFIMDLVDMDSAKFAQYAERAIAPMRLLYRREARTLFRFEQETAARADVTTFVSEAEASLFRTRTGLARIEALSNGIDLETFHPDASFPRLDPALKGPEPLILFSGQMDYAPNVDAVRHFANEILPRLEQGRFVVAGRNPGPEVRKLESERVHVTGVVEDMRSWIAAADLVVAPLRIARGIQNKVLEAMAMGKPVIASPAAFEGIEAEAGTDLIVSPSDEDMAQAIRFLLASPDTRAAIGRSARKRVEADYGWDRRLERLDQLVFSSDRRSK